MGSDAEQAGGRPPGHAGRAAPPPAPGPDTAPPGTDAHPSAPPPRDPADGPPPGEPEPAAAADGPPAARAPRRPGRARRVLVGALVLLALGLVAVGGLGWWAVGHYTGRVDRIPDAFPSRVPEAAQPAPTSGGQTFLLVGLDSRSDVPTTGRRADAPDWVYGAQRSDTMMLVHLPADHAGAYVVSLPRDSWVNIPGHGTAKLNAAYSWGGPPLLIDTVQRLTRVRVDHLAIIDWAGFTRLTDELGGVDLTVDGTRRHLDGAAALRYVRERHALPRGDLDRTHRQQYFLRALLSRITRPATFTNPLRAGRVLGDLTDSVSVDDRLDDGALRRLLWDARGLRAPDTVFLNAPVTGTATVAGQSVVRLDQERGRPLWQAMTDDTLAAYLASHPVDRLGAATP